MANEKRLIDANALMDDAEMDGALYACLGGVDDVRFLVDSQPTVDAVEVVHARWENGHCTNCTHYAEVQNIGFTCTGEIKVNYKHTNYCPNCGARMDGDSDA